MRRAGDIKYKIAIDRDRDMLANYAQATKLRNVPYMAATMILCGRYSLLALKVRARALKETGCQCSSVTVVTTNLSTNSARGCVLVNRSQRRESCR